MDGNSIASLVVTQSQYNFLKRLSSNSTLGVVAASGSCGSGATESAVLGAVVCISTSEASGSADDESSGKARQILCVDSMWSASIVEICWY